MAKRTVLNPGDKYRSVTGTDAPKPYIPFNWNKIGEPLTPLIWLQWRAGYITSFPNRINRIYIQQADFNVLDENGFSSATITLADPDFINLEDLFTRALFHANTGGRNGNYWYIAAMWGWSFYGTPLKNPQDVDKDSAQYKLSGKHYFMLSNLSYTIDDVELVVTIELIDIGQSVFGSGDEAAAKKTVGIIKSANSYTAGGTSNDNDTGISIKAEALKNVKNKEAYKNLDEGADMPDIKDIGKDAKSSGTESDSESENMVASNVFKNKTRWQIIKAILESQDPEIKVEKVLGPNEKDPDEYDEPVETYTVSETAGLRETIEKLLSEMPSDPRAEELEGMHAAAKQLTKPVTKHWEVMAGGIVVGDDPIQRMVFGWAPDPPTRGQSLSIGNKYRLARIFTYRPGLRREIAEGETMITELSYDWTSQGYWNFGMPSVFGLAKDRNGNVIVVESKEDWAIKRDKISQYLVGGPPTVKSKNTSDSKTGSTTEEARKKIDLEEAVRKAGLQLDFNFSTNLDTEEKIITQGKTVILNVWNQLYKELLDVTIRIPGDPFLDNRILSRSATAENDTLKDLLVDIYNAYFIIKVYRETVDGSRQPSKLFEGKYLCLNGCSHRIDEGEYTTELKLFKAF